MKEELSDKIAVVEEAGRAIEAANKPTVTEFSDFDKLGEFGALTYEDIDGTELPYLNDDELHALLVTRGTLTREERAQIESHVNHTYEFLSTIPWTRDLRDIPVLARSHHEKLDGSGYPRRFHADAIPPQTRMMTIADIYDALTAKDRPYKPAIKTERALAILEDEANSGKIDRALLDLFVEAKVFQHGLTS
jgi:hypothetical protein